MSMNTAATIKCPYSLYSRRLILTLLAMMSLVSGCVTVPKAGEDEVRRALAFTPDPDNGTIYVYREWKVMGGGSHGRIRLDGTVYPMPNGSFYRFVVPPGRHDVWGLGNDNRQTLIEVDAKKGGMYYLQSIPFALSFDSASLIKVDENTARAGIRKCTQVIKDTEKGPKVYR